LPVEDIKRFFLDHAKSSKCNNEENISLLFKDLSQFLNVQPQLPSIDKQFIKTDTLDINVNQNREEIVQLIKNNAGNSELALLSLYAFRQMDAIDWRPFVKTALERNPVSLVGLSGKTVEEVYQCLRNMDNESVYDSIRLAQPDEVWNFNRGDGVEKAFLMANYLVNELKKKDLNLKIDKSRVVLASHQMKFEFTSTKEIVKEIHTSMFLPV
jgi:hypothetical protein